MEVEERMDRRRCAEGFARRLNRARKSRGLTQADLAAMLGKSPNRVSEYETGKVLPGMQALCELADALGVSCDYLARGKR